MKEVLLIITQDSSCKPGLSWANQNMWFITLYRWGNWSSQAIWPRPPPQTGGKAGPDQHSQASRYVSLRHLQFQGKAASFVFFKVLLWFQYPLSRKANPDPDASSKTNRKQERKLQFLSILLKSTVYCHNPRLIYLFGGEFYTRAWVSHDWHAFCWDNGASMNVSVTRWTYHQI